MGRAAPRRPACSLFGCCARASKLHRHHPPITRTPPPACRRQGRGRAAPLAVLPHLASLLCSPACRRQDGGRAALPHHQAGRGAAGGGRHRPGWVCRRGVSAGGLTSASAANSSRCLDGACRRPACLAAPLAVALPHLPSQHRCRLRLGPHQDTCQPGQARRHQRAGGRAHVRGPALPLKGKPAHMATRGQLWPCPGSH